MQIILHKNAKNIHARFNILLYTTFCNNRSASAKGLLKPEGRFDRLGYPLHSERHKDKDFGKAATKFTSALFRAHKIRTHENICQNI